MHGGWVNQRDPGFREAVPRFFLALILAASSLLICRLVLVLISNISCYVAKSSEIGIWSVLGWFLGLIGVAILAIVGKAIIGAVAFASTGVLIPAALAILVAMLGLIIMVIGFFMMMFGRIMLQLLIRVAMLAVLIVLSPLAFVLMATPDTEEWTHKWISMFVSMAITQTLQLITLYLASKVFNIWSVAAPGGVPMWTGLVVGIIILYLVGKIPSILDRHLGEIVSGGSAPGMLPGAVSSAGAGLESKRGNDKSIADAAVSKMGGGGGGSGGSGGSGSYPKVNNPSGS